MDHHQSVVCVRSVLQLIPQFSPECEDATGVPVELPVKAGLAVLQVSHHCSDLDGFFFQGLLEISPAFIVAAQGGIIILIILQALDA